MNIVPEKYQNKSNNTLKVNKKNNMDIDDE